MIRKWRTLHSFAPADRECLWHALRLLPVVRVRLRMFGLRRTQSWLSHRNRHPSGLLAMPEERLWQIVRMVRTAQRYHRLWSNCLSHSLTLWALLQRAGIASEIRVGTRLQHGRMEAHAWVEYQGQALTEPGDETGAFAAFDRPLVGGSR